MTHVRDAIAWLEVNDKPVGMIFCEHEPSDIKKFTRAEKAEKSIDAGIAEVRKPLQADGSLPADGRGSLPDDIAIGVLNTASGPCVDAPIRGA